VRGAVQGPARGCRTVNEPSISLLVLVDGPYPCAGGKLIDWLYSFVRVLVKLSYFVSGAALHNAVFLTEWTQQVKGTVCQIFSLIPS